MINGRSSSVPFVKLAALFCIFLAFSSCHRDEVNPLGGQEVRFTAATGYGPSTKTAYSGVMTSNRERIDWQADDLVRVYCAEAQVEGSTNKYADYVIKDGSVSADGYVSQARITQTTQPDGEVKGLWWGSASAVHHFYAVYPSPATAGKASDTFPGSSPATTVTFNVPAIQTPLGLNAAAAAAEPHFTAVPDLTSEYMVAMNAVTPDDVDEPFDTGEVFLKFKPIVTAIEFTITNDFAADAAHPENEILNIKSIELISDAHNIAGPFTADLTCLNADATAYPVCASSFDGKTVTMDFTAIPDYDYSGNAEIGGSRYYVAVAKGKTLRFTFFLKPDYASGNPVDIDDLTFKVNRADGSWVSTKLAYNDAAKTGVVFPCHKKSYVTGILMPEGAQWTVKYSPDVNPWIEDASSVEPTPELHSEPLATYWTKGYTRNENLAKYNYDFFVSGELEFLHEGTTNTASYPTGTSVLTITSQRELNHVSKPVVWHLEYWDSASSEWKPAVANTIIDGLVTLDKVNGAGGASDNINLTVAAATSAQTSTHNERLRTAPAKGTLSAPYDLSMYDIYGTPRAVGKPVTANCYVIDAPGWYALPLIYGNGIDFLSAPGGGVNSVAYNPGEETSTTATFLSRFIGGAGTDNLIYQPYIQGNLGVSGEWRAYPLWQDVASGAILADDACTVLSKSQAAAKGLTACNCGYLMFRVNQSTLTQGNVLLALTKDGAIVWSWHIWVTDNDLSCTTITTSTKEGRHAIEMLPLNLGWVDDDAGASDYYEEATVKLRMVQSGSNSVLEFNVGRIDESIVDHSSGSSPYWQWGRKDPFIRGCASQTVHGGTSFSFKGVTQTVALSIASPTSFTSRGGRWFSGTDSYRNMWSAMNDGEGTAATGYDKKPKKTVYDPCPPGFQVPQGNAFTGFEAAAAAAFLSPSGYRSETDGAVVSATTGAYYWTAVPYESAAFYGCSMVYSETVNPLAQNAFSRGLSIRPVKE